LSKQKPSQSGPFELKDNAGGIVGSVTIDEIGALVRLAIGPFGREDLRKIGHHLLDIADYDTGLRE
jgi:hypothetical protein